MLKFNYYFWLVFYIGYFFVVVGVCFASEISSFVNVCDVLRRKGGFF